MGVFASSVPILDLPVDPHVAVSFSAGFGDAGHHTGKEFYGLDGDVNPGSAVIIPFDGYVVYSRSANGGFSTKNVPFNALIPATEAVLGASVSRDDDINSENAVWTVAFADTNHERAMSLFHVSEQSLLPSAPQSGSGILKWTSTEFFVHAGTTIAKTGGARNEPGRGFSSGPHFHLQTVQRLSDAFSQSTDFNLYVRTLDANGNFENVTLTDAELSVGNLRKTPVYSAMPTTGSIVATPSSIVDWEFESDGDLEGWTAMNMSAVSVSGGNLFLDPAGSDPYIMSPDISVVDSDLFNRLEIRFANNSPDGNSAVYFRTAAENFFSEDKQVKFVSTNCSICGDAPFYTYDVKMGSNPKWTGTITGIRFDPAMSGQGGTNSDSIGIDYIQLVSSEGDFPISVASVPDSEALIVGCASSEPGPISSGQAIELEGSIIGGLAPFTFQWSGVASGSSPTVSYLPESVGDFTAVLAVTDANLISQTATCPLNVVSPTTPVNLVINARLDDDPWSGQLSVQIVGPSGVVVDGNVSLPYSVSVMPGLYTVQYRSGGPLNAAVSSVSSPSPCDDSGNTSVTCGIEQPSSGANIALYVIDFQSSFTRTQPSLSGSLYTYSQSGLVNQATPLNATFHNAGTGISDAILDVELYDSYGNRVFQQYLNNQKLLTGASVNAAWSWTPVNAGSYRVKLGIFTNDWSTTLLWVDDAADLAINAPASEDPGTTLSIWWPSPSGAVLTGLQPLKVIMPELPLSAYQCSWSVDGGQPVAMFDVTDESNPYADHKEATIDLSGWTWRNAGNGQYGPFVITFTAVDPITDSMLSQVSTTIYVAH